MQDLLKTILILLLVAPGMAYAADGDQCSDAQKPGDVKGQYNVSCRILCDDKDSGDGTCAEYDTQAEDTVGTGELVSYEVESAIGCTSTWAVAISDGTTSGNTPHSVVTLNDTFSAGESPPSKTKRRYVGTVLSDMDDCTNVTVLHVTRTRIKP